jgi:hypothetical protein
MGGSSNDLVAQNRRPLERPLLGMYQAIPQMVALMSTEAR